MNTLKNNDISILQNSQTTLYNTYDVSQYESIIVEVSIYDNELNSLIIIIRNNLAYFYQKGFVNTVGDVISFKTSELLEYYNFLNASYRVVYKFYKNILASDADNSLFIKSISPSRKELQIFSNDSYIAATFEEFASNNFFRYTNDLVLNKYANFDSDTLLLVVNAKVHDSLLILKLYDPLPDDIPEKAFFWMVEIIANSIEESVVMNPPIDNTIYANFLAPPKFEYVDADLKLDNRTFDSSYATYDDFKNKLNFNENTKILSNIDFNSVDIFNQDFYIDYTNFSSYCKFGSMRAKLDNYVIKLKLIEIEQAKLDGLSSTIYDKYDSYNKNDSTSVKYIASKKLTEIYSTFTQFEKSVHYGYELFFESDLYPNETLDLSVPKTGTHVSNFVYIATTNTTFTDWYEKIGAVLDEYDLENRDSLFNLIPSFIKDDYVYDETNKFYLKFVDMVGEFFDNLFLYISNLENISSRNETEANSAPDQLIWNILHNSGFEMNAMTDVFDLSRFLYGYYVSNSTLKTVDMSDKAFTQTVWKRILNNIPLLLKTKGTRNSIRYLMNCYGIPNNYILIQEFGGPKIKFFDSSYNDTNTFDFVEFTHYLNMTDSAILNIPWTTSSFTDKYPDTVEFRFKLNSGSTNRLFQLSNGDYDIIAYSIPTYDDLGYVEIQAVSSSTTISVSSSATKLYNNEFYYANFKRNESTDDTSEDISYSFRLVNHDSYINKIVFDETLNITGSYLTEAYVSQSMLQVRNFNGSIDEFRLWHEVLDDDVITYHAMFPYATNGNSVTSSLSTLSFRLSMDDPTNLYITSSLQNEGYAKSYYDYTASVSGFVSMSAYPYNYGYFERANTILHKHTFSDGENAKLRIEDNWLPYTFVTSSNGTGSVELKALYGDYKINGDRIPYHKSEFDDDTPDSSILIVGISPVGLINNDIYGFFGNANIFDELADFETNYKTSYGTLDELANIYWTNTKNVINYSDYFRYFESYDVGLFKQIKSFIPAKMSPAVGKIHSENILRRSKIRLIDKEVGEYSDPKEKDIQIGSVYNTKTVQNSQIGEMQHESTDIVDFSKEYVDKNDSNIVVNIEKTDGVANDVHNGLIEIRYEKNIIEHVIVSEGSCKLTQNTDIENQINSETITLNNTMANIVGKEYTQEFSNIGIKNAVSDILQNRHDDVIDIKPDITIYKFNERKLMTDMQYSVRRSSIKKTVKKSAELSSANTIDGKPPVVITLSNRQNLKVSYSDVVKLIKN